MTVKLRDYQERGIEMLRDGFRAGHSRQMLYLPTGGGKCLGRDTPVIMADGSVKMVQDVRVGDCLLGPDGGIRNVLSLANGRDFLWEIRQSAHGFSGKYVVNSAHILSLVFDFGAPQNINVIDAANLIASGVYPMGWRIPLILQGVRIRQLTDIEIVCFGPGEYFGFEIDGDKLFLLGDFTVTHNTEISLHMMVEAAAKGNRSSFIADRRNLVNQTSARMDRYKIPHGVQMAGSDRMRLHEPIQVCSAQTLEKRGSAINMAALIVDEAHQIRKETVKFLDANPKVKGIGLSATPLTKGLGKVFTNVVCPIVTNELVKQGSLIMPTIYCAHEIDMVSDNPDGSKLKKVAGEWSAEDVGKRAKAITGDIVATWIEKTTAHFNGPVKTIVHGSSVDHCAELAQRFAAAGFNFVAISYRDDEDFKEAVYNEFCKRDSKIMGIIAVDMLTKGFDCPDVLCSVMARPFSKSVSSIIQQIGRIMRIADGKDSAILIDHAGNFLRHGEQIMQIFEEGIFALDDGAEKSKPEKTPKEKEACKCPKCGALWLGASDTCGACGYARPTRNRVVEVAGKVSEFESRKIERQARQEFYSQLITVEISKGYKTGWAKANFKDKFGNWPDGYRDVPAASVSPQVASWVKSKRIAWANRRAAE